MLFQKMYFRLIEIKPRLLFLIGVGFVLFSGFMISIIEPQTFTFRLGVWWTMTTITTIGYGDIAPVTLAGQLFGMCIVDLFGIMLFGAIVGKVTTAFIDFHRRKKEGANMYTGKNQIVVVGWTESSKLTIQDLLSDTSSNQSVVLIDKLDESPISYHSRFHYIKGSPTDFSILEKANIKESSAIMIFSPDHIHNSDLTDGYTLLVSTTIERYGESHGKNIYTVVEIQKEAHKENFKHIKVDQFILVKQSISHLMLNAARHDVE